MSSFSEASSSPSVVAPNTHHATNTRRPSTGAAEVTNKVIVDFWETQRYRPLQGGWSAPYLAGHHYSNSSGKQSVNFHQVTDDKVPLPFGWKWSEKPWRPDKESHIYGEVDDEGWSYANSMDLLIKQTYDRQLKAERSSMTMVRRRRWIRSRYCVDPISQQVEAYRNEYAQTICKKIREVTEFNSRVQEHLEDHHLKWIRSVDTVMSATDQMLLEILSILDYLISKLQAMDSFLVESGALELMYAHKLKDFSNKWKHAGNAEVKNGHGGNQQIKQLQDKLMTSLTKCNNDNYDGSSSVPPSPTAPQPQESGFFHVVSSTNLSIVDRKLKYGALLSEMLPADVRQLIKEVNELLTDCNFDADRLRTELVNSHDTVKSIQSQAVKCFDKSILRMVHMKGVVLDSLHHINITHDITKHLPLINPDFLDEAHQVQECNEEVCSDIWLHLVSYGRKVIETNSKLLLYHAEAKMLMKKTNQLAAIASNMLKSTIKVIVHEHFKVYQESFTMLETLGIDDKSLANKLRAQTEDDLKHKRSDEGNTDENETPEEDSILISSRSHSPNQENALEGSPMYKNLSNNSAVLIPFLPSMSHVAKWGHLRFALLNDDISNLEANSVLSVVQQNNPIKWRFALCVFTFDGYFHMILAEPDKTYSSNPSTETSVATNDDEFRFVGTEKTLESYLMRLDEFNIALSLNFRSVKVSPTFVPKDGFRDAFEVRLSNNSIMSSSSSVFGRRKSGAAVHPSPSSKAVDKIADLGNIEFRRMVFIANDSIAVRDWMHIITCPFANSRMEPPEVKYPIETLPSSNSGSKGTRKSITTTPPPAPES